MRRTWLSALTTLAGVIFLATCTRAFAADDNKKGATVVTLDNLSSRAPSDWKPRETQGQMRAYQFALPKSKDDQHTAEIVVFYFGSGGAGGVDANVKRWKGMFIPPEGKTIDDVSKVENMKVSDRDVTYVDVQGAYKFKERPFDPMSKEELRPDYRLLGVVFDTAKGPYFIRFVGPAKTVGDHKKDFDAWLKAFKQ